MARAQSQLAAVAPPENSVEAIEIEHANITRRRETLAGRHASIVAEVEAAQNSRRDLLVRGDASNTTAIDKADAACRDAESRKAGLDDALAEIGRMEVDASARLTEAQAEAKRVRVAAKLEADATSIYDAAREVDRTIAAFEKALLAFRAAIPKQAAPIMHNDAGTSPEYVVSAAVGQALARLFPSITLTLNAGPGLYAMPTRLEPEATSTAAAVNTILIEKMGLVAKMVRDRSHSPDLLTYVEPEPDFDPGNPEMEVVVLEPLLYHRRPTDPVIVTPGVHSLPHAVALVAINAMKAIDTATHEGQQAIRAMGRREAGRGSLSLRMGNPTSLSDCHDLGFDLSEWRANTIAFRRAEWAKAA